jgi:hypothetical protein
MIINLNQHRKKRRRAEAETQAKENRVRFGRSKEERTANCANASARNGRSKTSASTSLLAC